MKFIGYGLLIWCALLLLIVILHYARWPREPDFIIGKRDNPYLKRWWVIPRNRFFNIYLHHFLHSDDDRALHDHPWYNVSILLRGEYIEVMSGSIGKIRRPFWPVFRHAKAAHRVLLFGLPSEPVPVWSLFITGPVIREWGFHCLHGWRHWKDFTAYAEIGKDGKGQLGKGCD